MKRVAIILCIAALGLTACAPENSIGKEEDFKFQETVEPSPSPTKPSKKPTKRATPTKKPTVEARSNYKPRTYKIKIRNVNDQYQPREMVLYEGDILIFENLDPSSKHSLTEGASQQEKNPTFDSGELSDGQRKKWVVDWAPGDYNFHCSVVPYIQGGPIRVLKNPQL